MALFTGLFGKKKELRGDDLQLLLETMAVDREPVIVQTKTFKFVSDLLDHDTKVFQLSNNLSRDEVMYQIKGQTLQVSFPYELTLYSGETSLVGLGMVRGRHTLKFAVPEQVIQEEHRGAYRVSKFPGQPRVTFTTSDFHIIKASLVDLSMTGAGLRIDPRLPTGDLKLSAGRKIMLDIYLRDDLHLSTSALIRYVSGPKMGIEFEAVPRDVKDKLYKFIVAQRRDEYRGMVEAQQKLAESQKQKVPGDDGGRPAIPIPVKQGKPTALVAGDSEAQTEMLKQMMNRKFQVLECGGSISDIRAHLELKPNLCLLEIQIEDRDRTRQLKKLGSMVPPGSVLMYYGEGIDEETKERFRELGDPEELIVETRDRSKLMVFKQIQHYFDSRVSI